MTLRIAPNLALPDRFATEGVVVMGVRGSGKSNTEVRFAELLYGSKIPFVAVDPKGDWWGIRSSADGSGPGLAVPVFGGLHGDFPLDASLGARIADVLVDENLSAVLDVSKLAKTTRLVTFLVDFCNQLMERHQAEPHVRCVILEEAHRYIPQQVKGNAAALKEAAASVLLEGRAFGLGCWACTQRPARLHNDVLEECDTAIIHRMGVAATADLKRVRDWVKHEDLSEEIAASLTKLAAGEAWVLAPVSLGIVQRVQIERRNTFDSGATPAVGLTRRAMSTMADIDVPAINDALAEVIAKAKADDPREMRRRIAELEKQLAATSAAAETGDVVPRSEYDDLRRAYEDNLATLEEWDKLLADRTDEADEARARLASTLEHLRAALMYADAYDFAEDHASATTRTRAVQKVPGRPTRSAPSNGSGAPPPDPRPVRATHDPDGELGGGDRKVLAVLAMFPAGRTRRQLCMQTGYSAKASTIGNILARLRKAGYVERAGEPIRATPEGIAKSEALGDRQTLPTGPELLEYWRKEVGAGDRAVLDILVARYPSEVPKAELCALTGYSPDASTIGNILARLRRLELVDGWRASDELMEAVGG